MRICLLTADYPPASTEGIARQRYALAVALADLGHEVRVVTCGRTRAEYQERGVTVRVVSLPRINHFSDRFPELDSQLTVAQALYEGLEELLAAWPCDVVEVPLWAAQGFVAAQRYAGPLVICLQTTTAQINRMNGFPLTPTTRALLALERLCLERADGWVADSRSVREVALHEYRPNFRGPIEIAYHGIADWPDATAARPERPVVEALVVGRLEQRKGTPLLMKQLPALLRRFPQLRVCFAGRDNSAHDGWQQRHGVDYPTFFRRRNPGLADRVEFTGYVDDRQLEGLYRRADLLLAPSRYESFGLMYLEAMRAGLPVVAFASGGASEIFAEGEAHGGVVMPLEQERMFAQAAARLIEQPALRRELGARGLARFRQAFSDTAMAEATLKLYRRAIEHRRASSAQPGRLFQVSASPAAEPLPHKGAAEPAVSIITPYYNTGALFEETVAAVRAQTLQQWEWLIVNDGSTDAEALRVLETLRGTDPRIRVIDQPNRGLPAARNAGVAAGRAPLLFFLDSDDLIAPTALEQLAWLLSCDRHAAFATAWCAAFGAESFRWLRGFESRAIVLFENTATPLTMMRRNVFDAVGGFDEGRVHGLEDYELWLRCAAQGFWGRDLPEVLVYQRRKTAEQYVGYAWPTRDVPAQFRAFQHEMRARFPLLYRQGVPVLPRLAVRRSGPPALEPPFANRLVPAESPRLLLVGGGLPELAARLRELPGSATLCALRPAGPERPEDLPPDRFVLPHMLHPADYGRFLVYLLRSRAVEAALIEPGPWAEPLALLLRGACPQLALLDWNDPRVEAVPPAGAQPAPAGELAQHAAALGAALDREVPSTTTADAARRLMRERLMLWAYPLVLRARQERHRLALHPAGRLLRQMRRALGRRPQGYR
ncbi:MAG TPA: glycosyltransferase [Roseiflexaceae bacterium]|nr:glycosyltransferase [Roseiflexaceae bacterium]